MADAFGVGDVDGLVDMELQVFRFGQARPQLAGVQGDVGPRVGAVQIGQHPHLEGVVAQGAVPVLGLDQVDRGEPRVPLGQAHAQFHLREDPFGAAAPGDLGVPAHGQAAAGGGTGGAAARDPAELGVRLVRFLTGRGHQAVQLAVGHQGLVHTREVAVPTDLIGKLLGFLGGGGDQRLQVELVLLGHAVGDLRQQRAAVAPGHLAELAERVEEVVVPRLPRREVLHGPGAHQRVVERPVGPGVRRGPLPRPARRRDRRHGLPVDAQPVLRGECDQELGGDGAGKVVVQITALRQVPEEAVQPCGVLAYGLQIGGGACFGRGQRACRTRLLSRGVGRLRGGR